MESYIKKLDPDEALIPLLRLAETAMQRKTPVLIGLDGRCGSGKTTLAARFAAITGFPVVHADDFFLPFDMRTAERLARPGGNIHIERLIAEVLQPAVRGETVRYGRFDCSTGKITEQAELPAAPCILIEGSYCLHPLAEAFYDVKAFCDVSPAVQRERLIRRGGEACLPMFESRWIPLEEAYFAATNIQKRCDLVLQSE